MSVQMALVSAQQNGDPYPIGETLVVDGVTTIMAALFGSCAYVQSHLVGRLTLLLVAVCACRRPFGTVVYFGHPVHKNIGGNCIYVSKHFL